MFNLCRRVFKCTVAELEQRLSYAEFVEWVAEEKLRQHEENPVNPFNSGSVEAELFKTLRGG